MLRSPLQRFSTAFFSTKMTENVDFDAIVIGGGIMGTCSAYHLAKRGSKTLMLEQFEYGHKNGSSHGASRITRIVHTSPMYLKLAQAAYSEWNELSQSSKTTIFEPSGLLWLDDEKNTRQRHEFLSKHSIEHELLHGPTISERFQHLSYNNEWYAIYDPKAGVLLADKCQEAAQKQFMNNGGTAHFSEKVLNITPGKIIKVETDKNEYKCNRLIVTAGPWLSKMLPDLIVKTTPMLVGVNFWKITSNHELYKAGNKSPCLMISEDKKDFYVIPEVDHPNLIKGGIHDGVPFEINQERPTAPQWTHSLPAKHFQKHLKYVDCTTPVIRETCLYTVSEDQNCILDRHPQHGNIVIGGGFSGTGYKFAILFGKLLSKMALEEDISEFELDQLKADRKIEPLDKMIHY